MATKSSQVQKMGIATKSSQMQKMGIARWQPSFAMSRNRHLPKNGYWMQTGSLLVVIEMLIGDWVKVVSNIAF